MGPGNHGWYPPPPLQPGTQPMPRLIPPQVLYSLLVRFAPCFTQPNFAHFVSFVVCLRVSLGCGTSTAVLPHQPAGEPLDQLLTLPCALPLVRAGVVGAAPEVAHRSVRPAAR